MKKLLVNVLERVDKKFLLDNKYASIRKKEFVKKPGIYALYNKNGKLYYVGRASDLNGRLTQHLKHNKHSGKWDYCSIYFTKTENTAIEVEAVALSMLWGPANKPEGNTQKPRVKENKSMRDRILKAMKKINENMFRDHRSKPSSSKSTLRTRKSLKRPSLKGLFKTDQPLKAKYKAITFYAILLPSGEIVYRGKKYSTPSAAGKAASKKGLNGWTFWNIQNKSNKWVTLDKFVKSRVSTGAKAISLELVKLEKKPVEAEKQSPASNKAPVFNNKTLPLKAKHKGKIYGARLLSCGKRVQYGDKLYSSPSAAAKAITGSSVNGWSFWLAQASPGHWVKLGSLRKSFTDKAL